MITFWASPCFLLDGVVAESQTKGSKFGIDTGQFSCVADIRQADRPGGTAPGQSDLPLSTIGHSGPSTCAKGPFAGLVAEAERHTYFRAFHHSVVGMEKKRWGLRPGALGSQDWW